MLQRTIKWLLFYCLFTAFIYLIFIHAQVVNLSNQTGEIYVPDDYEFHFINAWRLSMGEGPYKSFSSIYPPGRFILLSILFRYISPSIPVIRLYYGLIATVFPGAFFLMAHNFFRRLSETTGKFRNASISFLLAGLSVAIYLFFINSAQEVHIFLALFFTVLFSSRPIYTLKNFFLGLLMGLIWAFRIDSGIFLVAAMLLSERSGFFDRQNLSARGLGFAVVWIPLLSYISLKGSLFNFAYDTFFLGLLIQPQMMSLPIPPAPVGKIFYALLVFFIASATSLYLIGVGRQSKGKDRGLMILAIFTLMGFSSGLGRSDEMHLWYGAVWLGLLATYAGLTILSGKIVSLRNWFPILFSSVVFFSIGWLLLTFKSALLFVALAGLFFLIIPIIRIANISHIILIAGIMTSFTIFHSLAFVRLRFSKPRPALGGTLKPDILTAEDSEVAGLKLSQTNIKFLEAIEKHLNHKNPWLFIYPDNVIYYDYFNFKNPTRHYYHTVETTDYLQREIIADLERTNTDNFLIFPQRITRKSLVWQWIARHTTVVATLEAGAVSAEVRRR